VLAALRGPARGSDHEQLVLRTLALGADVAVGTVGCSLTEIDGAGYRTPAASSPLALQLDEAQYGAASGPCVSAVRDRQIQRVDAVGADDRWSGFAAAARQVGVRSSLSYPVVGTARPTAVNVYSSADAAFDSPRSVAVAGLLANCIRALLLTGYQYSRRGHDEGEERLAHEQGRRVHDAVEHVMRRRDLPRSEAFAELAHRCRTEHTSIARSAERELAEEGQT
jgi:hypothetical protein